MDPADRNCGNLIYSERKYFQKSPAIFNWYSSSGIFCVTTLSNCLYSMLSTAGRVSLSWKVAIVTWSMPTLTLETSTNQEISISFAEEPGPGSPGALVAARGWQLLPPGGSAERDSQRCWGHGSCQQGGMLHPPRGCCPSSEGAQSSTRLLCCPFCRGWHHPEKAGRRDLWGK